MTTGGKSWNEVQPLFLMCSFLSFGEKSVRKLRLFFILSAILLSTLRCVTAIGHGVSPRMIPQICADGEQARACARYANQNKR